VGVGSVDKVKKQQRTWLLGRRAWFLFHQVYRSTVPRLPRGETGVVVVMLPWWCKQSQTRFRFPLVPPLRPENE
jgi:hypothetical protein